MTRGNKKGTILSLAVSAIWIGLTHSAIACYSAGRVGDHPICKIPIALPGEKVVVVTDEPDLNGRMLEDNHGYFTKLDWNQRSSKTHSFQMVDVKIYSSDRLYVVVHSYYPTIWRFTGETSAISKLISLGPATQNYYYAGYIGVAPDKIFFARPASSNVVTKFGGASRIDCNYRHTSCQPADYLFSVPTSEEDQTAMLTAQMGYVRPAGVISPKLTKSPETISPLDQSSSDIVVSRPRQPNSAEEYQFAVFAAGFSSSSFNDPNLRAFEGMLGDPFEKK